MGGHTMLQPLFALSNMLESSPLSRGMHWEHDLRVRIVESSSLMQPLAVVPQVRQGRAGSALSLWRGGRHRLQGRFRCLQQV